MKQTIFQKAHAIRKEGETLSQAIKRVKEIEANPPKPKKRKKKDVKK